MNEKRCYVGGSGGPDHSASGPNGTRCASRCEYMSCNTPIALNSLFHSMSSIICSRSRLDRYQYTLACAASQSSIRGQSSRSLYRSGPSMAVEIEQVEIFSARRQRSVPIEPLMINTHDALVAPVGFTEPVPSLLRWHLCRPDHSSTPSA